jgi:hypothetical protein
MKKLFITLIAVVGISWVSFAQPKIDFKSSEHNFGNIKHNVPSKHRFIVKNTGNEPLIIENVQPSCGCTTPDWTKDPIMPGKEGFIDAQYNAASVGPFNKTLTVISNTSPATTVLTIKGVVEGENATAAPAAPAAPAKPAPKTAAKPASNKK